MTKKSFKKLFESKLVFLDGGMGTLMQGQGMPAGVCPEKWASENKGIVEMTQKRYRDAGSDILYTFTFGANAIKLNEYGLTEEIYDINKTLAEVARGAAGPDGLVAGDISSCGSLLSPFGSVSFEEAVDSFKAQIRGLIDGGVDLFAIETMMDIQEARAALIAVKELCDLPVIVTMTFEGQRTLMGSDPISALVTLQALGADAVGCNCSGGPAEMVEIISQMKPTARVPLIAKPNAGKPTLISGKTHFNMDAESFASYAEALINAGANGLGGCCGTTPEYIEKMVAAVGNTLPAKVERKPYSLVCSNRKTVEIHPDLPLTVIGDRLSATGDDALAEALKQSDMDTVFDLALEQVEDGAVLLAVNAEVPGVDEMETLTAMVKSVCNAVDAPVLIDSSNPEALEAALRIYPGRAIINALSGEKDQLENLLPIAQKYGAMFVLRPVDEQGVPETAEERIAIIKRVYQQAKKLGFTKEDIILDGLGMPLASNAHGALETLKVISWCKDKYKVNTTLSLDNSAFLAMAVSRGLSTVILNPNNEQLMQGCIASDAIIGRNR